MELLFNNIKYNLNNTVLEEETYFLQELKKYANDDWKGFKDSSIYKAFTNNSELANDEKQDVVDLPLISQESLDIVSSNNNTIKEFTNNMNNIIDKLNKSKNESLLFSSKINEDIIDFSKLTADDFTKLNKILDLTTSKYKESLQNIDVEENSEDDKTEQLIQEDLPVEDPIYRTALQILYKDGSASEELKRSMLTVALVHQSILDMYTTTLYEDSWNDSDVYKFDKLMQIYNENLEIVKNELLTTEWNYKSNEEKFFEYYKEIVKDDNYTFNRMRARHQNYMRYRANRIALVWQLGHILGIPKLVGKKDAEKLFNVLNEQCDSYKLYDNKNEIGEPTENRHYTLKKLIEDTKNDLLDKANVGENMSSQYDYDDFQKVADFYVLCRKDIYAMFNICTSKRKYNGWEKWQNLFKSFCDAELKDITMRLLHNAIKSTTDYEEGADDWQEIDQRCFNLQGIYEAKQINETWWDEDVKWYKEHRPEKFTKDKIKSIKPISNDANVCKIYMDKGYVYSLSYFYPNDIIEICPTRKINKESLYTLDIRNIVFEVVHNTEWVMPFGYCQFYEPETYNKEANCEFYWEPKNRVIVIKAINRIEPNTKLILKVLQK